MLLLALLVGCPKPPAPPEPDPEPDPTALVVRTRLLDPAPDDCTAAPPALELFDTSAPALRRLDVEEGAVVWTERATLATGELITVVHGGCAHVGVSYRFPVASVAGLTTCAERYPRALALAEALPLRADQATFTGLDDLRRMYDPTNAAAMADCLFSDGFTTVTASLQVVDDGVALVLERSLAL